MIKISIQGDDKKLFDRLNSIATIDKTELNRTISEALRTSTIQRFQAQESPEGDKWQMSIRASRENGKTLLLSGRLRNSIKSKAQAEGFVVGTNTIYAATHQFGDIRTIRAKNSRGLMFKIGGNWIRKQAVTVKIPARQFLGISKEDYREIEGTLNDYFGGE